jgi:hypothetical protein
LFTSGVTRTGAKSNILKKNKVCRKRIEKIFKISISSIIFAIFVPKVYSIKKHIFQAKRGQRPSPGETEGRNPGIATTRLGIGTAKVKKTF